MIQFLYDIYAIINVIAFIIALLDKISCGAMSKLFWFAAKWFGGVGVTAACILFRHRTRSGAVVKTAFYGILQFGLLWLLDRIF